jgi:ABC-type uncharacterized transport system auxiliary subunit
MRSAILAIVWSGCTLTQPSKPVDLRYFAPELPARETTATPCAPIRIGRIHAGAELGFAIEHRVSKVEVQPYETLRWSELPETYVRQAIVNGLFSSKLFEEAISDAPVLSVEVVAFEDATRGTTRDGRVVLDYTLRDNNRVIARGQASAVHPAENASIEAVVGAIGTSLVDASDQLARGLVAARCR